MMMLDIVRRLPPSRKRKHTDRLMIFMPATEGPTLSSSLSLSQLVQRTLYTSSYVVHVGVMLHYTPHSRANKCFSIHLMVGSRFTLLAMAISSGTARSREARE